MSESKLTCPVVRDLLPLYHDRVVEEETAALVKEHLEDCPSCQGVLTKLQGELPAVAVPVDNQAGAELVRREKKLSTGRAVAITLAAGFLAILLILAFCGVEGPRVKVDPALVEVIDVRIGDETKYNNQFEVDYILHGKHFGCIQSHAYYTSEAILVIELRTPLFSFAGGPVSNDQINGDYGSNYAYEAPDIRVIVINDEVVWTAEKGILDRELG